MPGLTHDDLVDLFQRVRRLAYDLGHDNTLGWRLQPGRRATEARRRVAWAVTDGNRRVISLGYTRRDAFDALRAVEMAFQDLSENSYETEE